MSTDPWAHRSTRMLCHTCMWFVVKWRDPVDVPDEFTSDGARIPRVVERKPDLGRCRRRAPTLNGYPAVFEHDWCGDHKLDETKA